MRIHVVEAAPGVFMVNGPRTNWCLMADASGMTLVDAAWPKDYRLVVESLRQIGATPDQVEVVVLTHAHPDHVGVAEQFRVGHGAVVRTHRSEVAHAMGQHHEHVRTIDLLVRIWRPSVFVFALGALASGGSHPTAVQTVDAFDESVFDVPGGRLIPVPTPGHTSGHCSFHLPDHGVVMTGDALVNHNLLTNRPGPRLMPSIFSHDPAQAAQSLDALIGLEASVVLPGHGDLLHMTPADAVVRARERAINASWWDR